jgi:hypothetical protein
MTQPQTKKHSGNLLEDDRFKTMFVNPDFEVDKSAEEYRCVKVLNLIAF